mgnify:CR=1 FL=1
MHLAFGLRESKERPVDRHPISKYKPMTAMRSTVVSLREHGETTWMMSRKPTRFCDIDARDGMLPFDPEKVQDTATYEDPRRAPEGIPHVWIDGIATVRDGMRTEHAPGRALRSCLGTPA